MFDVAVIGGGPAGVTAALVAADAGARVCLFERQKRIGRRLAVTGSGRGNVGNRHLTADRYNASARPLLESIRGALDAGALEHLLASFGILTVPDDAGRLYPASRQAASIVWSLQDLLAERRVQLYCETHVTSFLVSGKQAGHTASFQLDTSSGRHVSRALVLAVGGVAQPALGGSDSYRQLLQPLNAVFSEPVPALSPLRTEPRLKDADGVRIVAAGSLVNAAGDVLQEETGEYQVTKTGISGIAAMQFARRINATAEPLCLRLDFAPDRAQDDLVQWLIHVAEIQPQRPACFLLDSVLPQKLAVALARPIVGTSCNHALSKKVIADLAQAVKMTALKVYGTQDWTQAQVMHGGVSVSEVHPRTLESRRVNRLFMCGEMLDVDGDTGGYNLHWAFISGQAAGLAAAHVIR